MNSKNSTKLTILGSIAFLIGCGIVYNLQTGRGFFFKKPSAQNVDQFVQEAPKISASNAPTATPATSANNLAASAIPKTQADASPAWQFLDYFDEANETVTLPETAMKGTAQIIRLNANFIDAPQMNLTLPSGQQLSMKRISSETSDDTKSWVGKDLNQPDWHFSITRYKDSFAGSIQTYDAEYTIMGIGDDRQVIYQVDTSNLPIID